MDNERTKHIVVRENLTVNECFITRGSVLTNIVIATFFIIVVLVFIACATVATVVTAVATIIATDAFQL
jgi:hypothetical protein